MSQIERRHEGRWYMAEIEQEIGKDRSTIRTWESWKSFPASLAFHRDANGWRYWTDEQMEEAKRWMASRNPGRTSPRTD